MDCRRYRSESRLSFAPRPAETEVRVEAARLDVPPAARLDLELEEDIDLERAVVGDAVRATLREGLKDGTRIAAPAGATVLGRVASLERQELPFAHYILALQFHTLETGERRAGFRATLEEAGPASGLIRQAKRMDPTFTRRRAPRLEILVKERREGQGVLHWDARQPRIRKGLRMRWRVEGEAVR